MDENVRVLKQDCNRLLPVADTKRKVTNLNVIRASELESNVHELLQHANKLPEALNDALQNVDAVTKSLFLDQNLNVFETSLNSVFTINEVIIENMVDAASSRITTTCSL